jgi:transcriptional antiterminator RfaH
MSLLSPPTLIDRQEEIFSSDRVDPWFVLRTRSRQEKVLARELNAQGVRNFLPLVRCTKYYQGRKALVEVPLFPGYLFLCGCHDDAYAADRTQRVAQIIEVRDQQTLDNELRNIHAALAARAPLDLYPYLKAGVRVEVRAGPFRGLQGVIEPGGHGGRLILQISMLGRAVAVEIEASLLDPID